MAAFAPPAPSDIVSGGFSPPPPDSVESFTPPSPKDVIGESSQSIPVSHVPFGESSIQGGPQLRQAGAPGAGAELASEFRLPTGTEIKAALPDSETLRELYQKTSASGLDKVLPEVAINPQDSKLAAVGKEAYNIAASIPKFATSPLGVATAPFGGMFPKTVATAFAGDALKNAGQTVLDAHKDWHNYTPAQKAKAVTDIVGNVGMAGLLGAGVARGFKGGENNATRTVRSGSGTIGEEGQVPQGSENGAAKI